MPRRAATVTQADIARTIRAMRDSGLAVVRVVVRQDGVALETVPVDGTGEVPPTEAHDERKIVVL